MSKLRVLSAGLCVTACLTLAGHTAPLSLNVKTGLWEMTTTGETSGAPPIPQDALARMSPEQRAKFEASMAAGMAHSSAPHVSKQCMTEKSLQRGFDPGENKGEHKCTDTVVSSSATVMEVRQECTGREKMSGHFRFEAVNPEVVNGMIDVTVTDGARTMTIKRVMHGKWLGTDCGSLKRAGD
jgi:hypothetical protein